MVLTKHCACGMITSPTIPQDTLFQGGLKPLNLKLSPILKGELSKSLLMWSLQIRVITDNCHPSLQPRYNLIIPLRNDILQLSRL